MKISFMRRLVSFHSHCAKAICDSKFPNVGNVGGGFSSIPAYGLHAYTLSLSCVANDVYLSVTRGKEEEACLCPRSLSIQNQIAQLNL